MGTGVVDREERKTRKGLEGRKGEGGGKRALSKVKLLYPPAHFTYTITS